MKMAGFTVCIRQEKNGKFQILGLVGLEKMFSTCNNGVWLF